MELFEPIIRLFWEGHWTDGVFEHRRRLYDCELVYLARGYFTIEIDGREHQMTKGMVAIIPPACWHESRVKGSRQGVLRRCLHFDWVPDRANRRSPLQAGESERFDERSLMPVPLGIREHLPLVASARAVKSVAALIEEMFARLRRNDRTANLILWPVLRHLIGQAASELPARHAISKPIKAVTTVKQYLDIHYSEPVSYDELQKLTRLTKCHLCTIFRKAMGKPPLEYLAEIRLAHARRMLHESQSNVAEVAYAVGFRSPNYFSRAFRRRFGQPPSAIMPR